jgi:TonB family protein
MTTKEVPIPVSEPAGQATPIENVALPREVTFLQVFTLVLWLTCLAVGLIGLWFERGFSVALPPPAKEPPPVQAEIIDVDLTPAPVLLASDQMAPAAADEPLPPDAPLPDVPPLPAVAAPSPAIAFALPVEGPVRIVSAAKAAVAVPAPVAAERLVFGQGSASAQPQPDYPDAARDANEQGVVEIEFSVGPNGRVTRARVANPSPWPVLNEAALSVVRDSWRNLQWSTTHPYHVSFNFHLIQ